MLIYKNIQYLDGVSPELKFGDLAMEGGRFVAAGKGDARDMSGLYAIPGLIDAHIHLCLNPEIRDPLQQAVAADDLLLSEMRERAAAMVKAGITTARDLGGGAHLELQVRDEINRNEHPGPRFICAGQPITSPGGHCHFWGGEAKDTAEAVNVLLRQHEHAVDLIKVMATGGNITPGSSPAESQFEEETLAEIVRVAAELGYHVAAHCHGTEGIGRAARAGVRTVEHCSWVGEAGWGKSLDIAIVRALADNNVWVSPTINLGWQRFRDEKFIRRVQENYKCMKESGVRLIASTDAGIPNVYHHDLPGALPVFAKFAGLTFVEMLRSATSDAARAIGLERVTGRIAEGLSADLVIYEANPLDDPALLKKPCLVVARGREIQPD